MMLLEQPVADHSSNAQERTQKQHVGLQTVSVNQPTTERPHECIDDALRGRQARKRSSVVGGIGVLLDQVGGDWAIQCPAQGKQCRERQ